MAGQTYRVHSTAPTEIVSELNHQLDSISQRLSALENGPIQPKSNIDLGGPSGVVTQAALKVVNLGNGTDEHDAVNLGQLNKATDLSKKLVPGPGITVGKGGNGTTIIGMGGTGGTSAGANPNATFVTEAAEAGLPNSRKLTQGTGVTVTDGGAGGNITISIGQSVAAAATPTFAGETLTSATALIAIINSTNANGAYVEMQISGTPYCYFGSAPWLVGGSSTGDLALLAGASGKLYLGGNAGAAAILYAGVQVGAPTGGDKGAGTLNLAGTLYENGSAYATGNLADVVNAGSYVPSDQSGAALAFTSVSASYTKLGNMVFAYGTVTYPATVDGSSAKISLPVAAPNHPYAETPTPIFSTYGTALLAVPIPNTTTFEIVNAATGANITNALLTGVAISFSVIYPAA